MDRLLAIDAGQYAGVGILLLILVVAWIVGGILRRRFDRSAARVDRILGDRIRQARFLIPPATGLAPCHGDHDLRDDAGWVVCQRVGCGYAHRVKSAAR